jgi:hypothetical protein
MLPNMIPHPERLKHPLGTGRYGRGAGIMVGGGSPAEIPDINYCNGKRAPGPMPAQRQTRSEPILGGTYNNHIKPRAHDFIRNAFKASPSSQSPQLHQI